MGLIEDLLHILNYYGGGYRYLRTHLVSRNSLASKVADNTLRVTLSRMKQRGLVRNKSGEWHILPAGLVLLAKLQKKLKLPKHVPKSGLSVEKPKKMIVIFDIPEIFKNKRWWLRAELTNLGFVMLQKSVWFGPAPLPKEFIKSLADLKLLSYLKFFKATESDIV